MVKDFYHDNVRQALESDGWRITHDPYSVKVDEVGYEIDFAAEPLLAAEKGVSVQKYWCTIRSKTKLCHG